MERVLIVGRGGTGKSTLARRLGERLGLPAIHLDRHYWGAGWQPVEPEQFAAAVAHFAAMERWVIEGNYTGTMGPRIARADTVLFLERPRLLCLLSIIGRVLRHRGTVRADMAEGCPERFDLGFLRFVWNWRRDRLEEALRPFAGLRVELRGRRAVRRYVEAISEKRPA